MRLPQSLLDRAEELVDVISEEAMNEFVNNSIHGEKTDTSNKSSTSRNSNQTGEPTIEQSIISNEISAVEREVFDIFSHITLLMNDKENGIDNNDSVNVQTVSDKVASLVEIMSPEFLEIVNTSSIEEIISAINDSTHENSTHNGTSSN